MADFDGTHVALATCHDKHNFGSMLQAWATQRFLELEGCEARTINKDGLASQIAQGRREHYARHAMDLQMYAEKVPFAMHRARQVAIPRFRREMAQRHQAFDRFSRDRFHFTRKTYSFEEAAEMSSEYDALVVGSDQLWLPVNIAGDYFTLSWAAPGVRKVAYATSVGLGDVDPWTGRRIADMLASYHAVSVREESAADLVESLTGTRPFVACDPTALLSREEWLSVANVTYDKIPEEPYAFVYLLGRNAWQRSAIRDYCRSHGLKAVVVAHNDSYVRADEGWADVYPWDAGPAEWLALIARASMVFADSYHAAVFSNVFEVPFVSLRRHAAGSALSTNSRIDTLLRSLGLKGRLCESEGELARVADAPVDFEASRLRLEAHRRESAAWLLAALDGCGRPTPHIEVRHVEDCCGCSACAAACPVGCIAMAYDAEGCEYPKVDSSRCIGCGRCLKACPVAQAQPGAPCSQRAFLAQHIDPQVLLEATSGGAMSALGQAMLRRGGSVYGAANLRDAERDRVKGAPGRLVVGHVGVDDERELARFRNSKYVQSVMGPTYTEVREQLASGRQVLFTGTPCQCEGLIALLDGHPANLVLADVVCRGVVCRAAFASYVSWFDARVGEADVVRFRDKARYGYNYSRIRAVRGDEVLYGAGVESDPYLRAFFSSLSVRPICHQCSFKKRYRESDLTCWDCYDIERFSEALDDNRGVTRVLVHSQAGLALLEEASADLRLVEVDADEAVKGVYELVRSVGKNPRRGSFMRDVETLAPAEVVEKWLPDSLPVKAERAARLLAQKTGAYDHIKRATKAILRK